MSAPPRPTPPLQVLFDPTPEIFATDSAGGFLFPLLASGAQAIETGAYDEVRFLISLWHPKSGRAIDPDRAYVELQGAFDSGCPSRRPAARSSRRSWHPGRRAAPPARSRPA